MRTRTRNRIRTAGTWGFQAALAGSLLIGQGQSARAQRVGNAGDAPVVPRSSAIANTPPVAADAAKESRLLLAHGLEMMIEGSDLNGLAMRASGVVAGPAADPRPSPAGVVGSSSIGLGAVEANAAANAALGRPALPVGTAGAGYTGTAGETVGGRRVGNGSEIGPRTAVNEPGSTRATTVSGAVDSNIPNAARRANGVDNTTPLNNIDALNIASGANAVSPGTANPGGPGASPMVIPGVPLGAGASVALLRNQAMRSFEAGERLMGQAMVGNESDRRLQDAATRYGNTLKSLASLAPIRVASAPAVITASGVAATPNAIVTPGAAVAIAPGSVLVNVPAAVGVDPITVALINHGVRDAIGSMKVHAMVRQMGGTSGPAGQQLMEHAQQMDAESRSLIQALATSGPANGLAQALAQQASELIQALQVTGP